MKIKHKILSAVSANRKLWGKHYFSNNSAPSLSNKLVIVGGKNLPFTTPMTRSAENNSSKFICNFVSPCLLLTSSFEMQPGQDKYNHCSRDVLLLSLTQFFGYDNMTSIFCHLKKKQKQWKSSTYKLYKFLQ